MEPIPPNRNLMPSAAEMETKPAEEPVTAADIRVNEKVLMKFDTIEALHRNCEIKKLPLSMKDHRHCYHLFVVNWGFNDKVSLRSLQTVDYDISVKPENVIVYKRELILSSPAMLKAADTFDANLKKQSNELPAYIGINEAITNAISAFEYIDLGFYEQIRTPFQTPFTALEESIRKLNEAYPADVYGGVAKMKQAVVADSLAKSYLLLAKLHEKWAETLRLEANDPSMDKTMPALIKLCENEAKKCLCELEIKLFTLNPVKKKEEDYSQKIDYIQPAGFKPETKERNGERVIKLPLRIRSALSSGALNRLERLHAEEDVVYKSPEGVRYLGSSRLPIWDPRNERWEKPRSLNFHNNDPIRFLIPNETHALLVFGCRGFACRFYGICKTSPYRHEKKCGQFVAKEEIKKNAAVESEENAAVKSEENAFLAEVKNIMPN